MEIVIHLWPLWLIGMLAGGAYMVANQVERIAPIFKKINLTLQDIAPLFFNGRKFTAFIVSIFLTFGFFILFCVSMFINIMRAVRLSVKLF
ncbi:MAG: hypothetical protein PHC61_09705 [Chitinivibrionales bacterium]|nr:hypothetical protein [Chitinivibrionales bacterium]